MVPVAAAEEADFSGEACNDGVVFLGHGSINLIKLLVILHNVCLVMSIEMVVHLFLGENGGKGIQLVGKRSLSQLGLGCSVREGAEH